MSTSTIEPEDLYVCASICRIDYRTNTCIGCGRPVIETPEKISIKKDQAVVQDDIGTVIDNAEQSA